MKANRISILLLSILALVDQNRAQTTTQNYISTKTIRVKTTNAAAINTLPHTSAITSIDYFDGFGKVIQNVVSKATPSATKDMVVPHTYNLNWQEEKNYLPYAEATGVGGAFKTNAIAAQNSFYNNGSTTIAQDAFPFSTKVFDGSALKRVLELSNPGAAWQIGSGHSSKMNYENNAAGDCLYWTLNGTNNGALASIYYAANSLFKIKSTDADGKIKYEYKDLNGNPILMRQQKDATIVNEATSFTEVYNIYDQYNNLVYVLNPAAIEYFKANGFNFTETSPIFLEQIYAYHYDYRNRIIEKKVPGKDWEYIVYNKQDQPILMQNAHLRALGKWQYSKFDAQGRMVSFGLWTDSRTRDQLQTLANTQTVFYEKKDATATTGFYYTNLCLPNTNIEVSGVSYYDDYNFNLKSKTFIPFSTYTAANTTRTIGLSTGSVIKVLHSNPAKYLTSIIYYDDYSRPIQSYKEQYSSATAWDRVDNTYNFAGEVTLSTRYHTGPQNITLAYRYEYDHMGRKTKTFLKVNTDPEIVHSDLKYNEIGQLIEKNIHGTGTAPNYTYLQSADYRYNIQGWLKSINNSKLDNLGGNNDDLTDAFGMELFYETVPSALPTHATAQYGGNISATLWKAKDMNVSAAKVARQAYSYSYDPLDRLSSAKYSSETSPNNAIYTKDVGRFNESLTYDIMGNILTLQRKGRNNVLVDNLTYDYSNGAINTNKLFKINDAAINDANFNDFKDLTGGTAYKYSYDSDGRLIGDLAKKVNYTYNHLDLPTDIYSNVEGGNLQIIYDATGRKLARTIPNTGITHFYMDGIETEFADSGGGIGSLAAASLPSSTAASTNTTSTSTPLPSFSTGTYTILFATTEEGRIRPKPSNANSYFFDYFLKDHLGNIRVTLSDEIPVVTYPVVSCEDKVLTGPYYYNHIDYERMTYSIPPSRISTIPVTTSAFDYNSPALSTPPTLAQKNAINKKCIRLYHISNNDSLKVWLPKVLKVNSGDKISVTVNAFYSVVSTTGSPLGNGFSGTFINSMLSQVPLGIPSADINTKLSNQFTGTAVFNSTVNSVYQNTYNTANNYNPVPRPKAYLLLLFYDQDFNLLKDQSYMREVLSKPNVKDVMAITNKIANVSGYCQIAVVNEQVDPVYFDKLQLVHTQSQTTEINEYYPFGLVNQQTSAKQFGSKKQDYKYNGKELMKEFGLEAEDYGARLYSPQIGRWTVIDEKAEKYMSLTPYHYAADNPIKFVDVDGKDILIKYMDPAGKEQQYKYGSQAAMPDNNFVQNTVAALDHAKTTDVGAVLVKVLAENSNKFVNIREGDIYTDNNYNFIPNVEDKNGNKIPVGTKTNPNDVVINSGDINYNPLQSIQFDNGKTISPSVALLHELGHAFGAFFQTAMHLSRADINDSQYGKLEERFATETFENPAAKQLGQGIRSDHGGTPINVNSPSSNVPLTVPSPVEIGGTEIKIRK